LNAGIDGPLGYGWTHGYAMALEVDADGYVSIRQENGTQIGFEPDGSGGYDATPGQFATLTHNRDGSWTLVRRQRETFQFASDGTLTALEDLNGYATGLASDRSGRLETITDEAGRTLTLSYDRADRIVGLRDAAGRTVAYRYDGAGDLVEVTDVRGQTWTYAYDDHLLLSRTDPNGHVDFENTYSADGEVLSQEDGEEGVTRFAYDPGVTRTTSPEGRVTEYRYVGGQLVGKVEGAGTRAAATWSYEYDPVTRGVTKTVDPRGNEWEATYDSAGLQDSTSTPLGNTTETTYDAQGNRLTFRDPMNVTTTWTYDAGGNLLTRRVPVDMATLMWRYAYGDRSHPRRPDAGDRSTRQVDRLRLRQIRQPDVRHRSHRRAVDVDLRCARAPGDEREPARQRAGRRPGRLHDVIRVRRGRQRALTGRSAR
jgi:YD repeat-containing protein